MKEFELSSQKELDFNNFIEKKRSEYYSRKNDNLPCMYYNCNKFAINSHAISKEKSLRLISKDGKVSCFESRRDKKQINGKELVINEAGINSASAFKGFCVEHDKIFDILDCPSKKSLVTYILLQAYRSVCFSLFEAKFIEREGEYCGNLIQDELSLERLKNNLELEKEEYEKIPDDTIMDLFKSLCENELQKYSIESKLLQNFKLNLENYLNSNEIEFSKEGKENKYIFCENNCDVCVLYKKVNFKVPIAMLNHHLLKIREQPNIFLFTVVPHDDGTEIFWIFEKKYYSVFEKKWFEMFNIDINILNMIEGSMMHCECWYVNPDVIETIPEDRLEIIKEDIYFNNERSPFDEYDLSIFDNLRKELVEKEDEITKEKENKKITSSVSRKNYLSRLEKFNQDALEY